MGKLIYLFMTVIAVQLCLIFVFHCELPGTSLWDFWKSPQDWDLLNFTDLLKNLTFSIGAVGLVIGGLIIKNDLMVFGSTAAVFFTFGAQLVNLWNNINAEATFGGSSGGGPWMASIIVVPIMLLYILTILEWWRGRD